MPYMDIGIDSAVLISERPEPQTPRLLGSSVPSTVTRTSKVSTVEYGIAIGYTYRRCVCMGIDLLWV